MKVLLLSPNTLTVPYPVYPLGLDYVAGAIGPQHQVQRYDLNCDSLDGLALLLQEFAPEVIGMACRNIDNTEAGSSRFFLDQYRDLVLWLRERSQARAKQTVTELLQELRIEHLRTSPAVSRTTVPSGTSRTRSSPWAPLRFEPAPGAPLVA